LFPAEHERCCVDRARSRRREGAVVPALWRWEVQDVLRRLHLAGKLNQTIDFIRGELRELPITIGSEVTACSAMRRRNRVVIISRSTTRNTWNLRYESRHRSRQTTAAWPQQSSSSSCRVSARRPQPSENGWQVGVPSARDFAGTGMASDPQSRNADCAPRPERSNMRSSVLGAVGLVIAFSSALCALPPVAGASSSCGASSAVAGSCELAYNPKGKKRKKPKTLGQGGTGKGIGKIVRSTPKPQAKLISP